MMKKKKMMKRLEMSCRSRRCIAMKERGICWIIENNSVCWYMKWSNNYNCLNDNNNSNVVRYIA